MKNIFFIIFLSISLPLLSSAADMINVAGEDALKLASGGGVVGDISTGDIDIPIWIRIGDWFKNLFNVIVTPCNQTITATCAAGARCETKVGPCSGNISLNAAPTNVVFTRYLKNNKHRKVSVSLPSMAAETTPVSLKLTKSNNFTTVIDVAGGTSYLFIALPTNPELVGGIKQLPRALANYLKDQDERHLDAVVIIYASSNKESWKVIAEQKIDTPYAGLNMQLILDDNVELTATGDLIVTYKNIIGAGGQHIPEVRVTYSLRNVTR